VPGCASSSPLPLLSEVLEKEKYNGRQPLPDSIPDRPVFPATSTGDVLTSPPTEIYFLLANLQGS
jgi:hypothetical protein